LELQRFLTLLNLRPIELHATFVGDQAVASPAPSTLVVRGGWCLSGPYRAPGAAAVYPGPRLLPVSVLSG